MLFSSLKNLMTPKNRLLRASIVFIGILLLFWIIEAFLQYKYEHPRRAIERRHVILPSGIDYSGIYKEFLGPADISITSNDVNYDVKQLRGVRLRTGAYGQPVSASKVELLSPSGAAICTSEEAFRIAENRWTNVMLTCAERPASLESGAIVRITVDEGKKWAIYKSSNGKPSLQLWFDDPGFTTSYREARDYGFLLSPWVLHAVRWFSRILIALGIVVVLFRLRGHNRRMIAGVFIFWLGLIWGQFFETITYHSPDEPAHVVGAFRSVTDPQQFQSVYEHLQSIGSRVQFMETFAKAENPLIAQKDGERRASPDNNFIHPEIRSGLYAIFAKPFARVALFVADNHKQVVSDPAMILRALLAALISVIVGFGAWFFVMQRRFNIALLYLLICSIPGVLASYLTIWNYGLLTAIGSFFCCGLMPEGEPDKRKRFLILAAGLIPVLGELARSQTLWFVIGPIAVISVAIFAESGSLARQVRSIVSYMVVSLLSCGLLKLLLGPGFIPQDGMLWPMRLKACEVSGLFCNFERTEMFQFLIYLQLLVWSLTATSMLILDSIWRYVERNLLRQVVWIKPLLLLGILVVLYKIIAKAWVMDEMQFLGSIAFISPIPSFSEHLRDAYLALMSQTFRFGQDYFLIQTFYMAYGWLEVTGHKLVYFVCRNFLHIGLITLLFGTVRYSRKTFQLYAPLMMAFFIYFFGVWYASWSGHFTIVGRFVFPAIGLVYGVIIFSMSDMLCSFYKKPQEQYLRMVTTVIFILVAASAIYGAFYLLPLRFAAGYDL
jgi:hypothetical protein